MRDDLESLIGQMRQGGILYKEAVPAFKKAFISAVLRDHSGNLGRSAAALRLHRNTLTRICTELGLDARTFRARRGASAARASIFSKRSAP